MGGPRDDSTSYEKSERRSGREEVPQCGYKSVCNITLPPASMVKAQTFETPPPLRETLEREKPRSQERQVQTRQTAPAHLLSPTCSSATHMHTRDLLSSTFLLSSLAFAQLCTPNSGTMEQPQHRDSKWIKRRPGAHQPSDAVPKPSASEDNRKCEGGPLLKSSDPRGPWGEELTQAPTLAFQSPLLQLCWHTVRYLVRRHCQNHHPGHPWWGVLSWC